MKKFWAVVLCALLCLSLSSCGLGLLAFVNPHEMTLEEYLEANQEEMDEALGSLDDSEMDVQISARDNSLLLQCRYDVDAEDMEMMKAVIDEMMDALSVEYGSILEDIRQDVPSVESVIVEYLTPDGELITSQEFTKVPAEIEPADTEPADTEPADTSETSSEPPADSSETPAATDGGMTLEDYVAANEETFAEMKDSMAASGMDIQILARGNSLVYSYRYTSDAGDTALLKRMLDEALDSMSSTFESTLEAIQIMVPTAESVVVEYLTQDGELITSREFK